MAAKALTVRLPAELYRESRKVAESRHISMNTLVQESLSSAVKVAEEERLYAAFTQVGQDMTENDVEFAHEAQWEAVREDS
ncbi:MAG TPA: hypothetical protein VGM23_04290 [Armatimonadota bacterium]